MDSATLWALGLATLAGLSIPIGAALSRIDGFLPDWMQAEFRHSVMAFGGGALIAAVALVLVPEGSERLGTPATLFWFGAGGVFFAILDRALSKSGGKTAQFMAMMLDFLPEAMALGALIAGDVEMAILIAALIALQNLPEAFNAYREMDSAGGGGPALMLLFVAMVPLGPGAAWLGLEVLSGRPEMLGAIMLFAGGGILYLLFEDVAPNVPLEGQWSPPLGAVAGFMLGLAGQLMIG